MKVFWPSRCCDYPHYGGGTVWRVMLQTRTRGYGLALTPGCRFVRLDGKPLWFIRGQRS